MGMEWYGMIEMVDLGGKKKKNNQSILYSRRADEEKEEIWVLSLPFFPFLSVLSSMDLSPLDNTCVSLCPALSCSALLCPALPYQIIFFIILPGCVRSLHTKNTSHLPSTVPIRPIPSRPIDWFLHKSDYIHIHTHIHIHTYIGTDTHSHTHSHTHTHIFIALLKHLRQHNKHTTHHGLNDLTTPLCSIPQRPRKQKEKKSKTQKHTGFRIWFDTPSIQEISLEWMIWSFLTQSIIWLVKFHPSVHSSTRLLHHH